MNKFKTIMDRERLSSESIAEKQDFNKVLTEYQSIGGISPRNKWVYGTLIGSAVITGIIATTLIDWETPVKPTVPKAIELPKKNDIQIAAKNTHSIPPKAVVKPIDREEVKSVKKVNAHREDLGDQYGDEGSVTTITEGVFEPPVKQELAAKPVNTMPHIGKYYMGEIPINVLCNNESIQSGGTLAIVSYTIDFFDGTKEHSQAIKGALIPYDICEKLGRYNLGANVRITSIVAEDRISGVQYQLPAMNITPVNDK